MRGRRINKGTRKGQKGGKDWEKEIGRKRGKGNVMI